MYRKDKQDKQIEERATSRAQRPAPMPREWQDDIRQAVEVMNRGGIILYPTDTVWGLGCDATNDEAVRRSFALKQRAEAKVAFYVREVPDPAWDLIALSERPLTIVYDGARNLAPSLIADDGSVALRVTRERFSNHLCMRMRRAVVSTSANISGQPSPRCFSEIAPEVIAGVDYVCTSRRDEKNPAASSIIKLGAGCEVKIIRE